MAVLKGSWDFLVISKVTILITPIKVVTTLLTKSHDPLSTDAFAVLRAYRSVEGLKLLTASGLHNLPCSL